MQPTPSNPCSALAQRDFAAIPDAPTAILSAQILPAAAQAPEYCIDDAANFAGVMPSQTPNDRIDWSGNDLFEPQ